MTEEQKEILDRVKFNGAVTALKQRIDSLVFELCHFNYNYKTDGVFVQLGASIKDAKAQLEKLDAALEALRELEPENR